MLCQWIFSQWAIKELFIDENDSVREWWFRSWLDRYVSKTFFIIHWTEYVISSAEIIAARILRALSRRQGRC